jgi:hypothetical protein
MSVSLARVLALYENRSLLSLATYSICEIRWEDMPSIFTNKDLEEFRAIWKEEFHEDISLDQAQAEAEHLLDTIYQMRTIYLRRLRRINQDAADKSV